MRLFKWFKDKLGWSCDRVVMYICVVIAVVAVMMSLIWVHAVNGLNDMYIERNAHLQMQIENDKELMAAREERIHELEKKIAADK